MQRIRPSLGLEALACCVWLLFLLCATTAASGAAAGAAKPDTSGKPRTDVASYYGTHAAGDPTASGKPFALSR